MTDLNPRGTVVGLGAAACAVCCAPPLMALLGIGGAGLAATLFTALLAGLTFAVVVAVATVAAVLWRRRQPAPTGAVPNPVAVEIGPRPIDSQGLADSPP